MDNPEYSIVSFRTDLPKNKDRIYSYGSSVISEIHKLQQNGALTDFTISLANGQTISCHKIVLNVSCHFFQTAFASGLVESKTNEMDLSHLDSQAV